MGKTTRVKKVTRLISERENLPDGLYKGLWGGYKVRLTYKGDEYELETEDGVKGMNIPVAISVQGSEIHVLSQKFQN